ncbi:MAG: cupin domain-containing protein [Anderseniella sp.]
MARSKIELFNLDSEEGGIFRQLAEGMSTTIFPGENAMLSVVRIDPHAMGEMHKHPEEQWGVMLSGSATRYQDEEEFQINKGDIWRTPPNAMHTMKAGPDGAVVLDIFSPVRKEYLSPGVGFSATN